MKQKCQFKNRALAAGLLLLMTMLPQLASAYDLYLGGIYYNIIDDSDNAIVTYRGNDANEYNEYTGNVTIPSTFRYYNHTYSVTGIGNEAFSGCSGLTSVTIPNSVTEIGSSAFAGCSSLTSVTIPNSVTSIGYRAFMGCSGLTSVTIPNSVTSIGGSAFRGCSGLTSVTIPNSVTKIGDEAFSYCTGLTSVAIGNSVTSIGGSAFFCCSRLTSVTLNSNSIVSKDYSSNFSMSDIFGSQVKEYIIGDDVTNIGNYAFQNCNKLTSLTIGMSVNHFGYMAYAGCSNLTSVTLNCEEVVSFHFNNYPQLNIPYVFGSQVQEYIIGEEIKSIGEYAFSGSSGLKSVTIPNSVTKIGWNAFENCSSLTSVTIPNSVTSIWSDTFRNCSSLTSVTIGNLVSWIGAGAFAGCSALTSVTIPNSVTGIGNEAFSGCSGLTSVAIGNSVTSIGSFAFSSCSGMTSVAIPKSVTSIGDGVFAGCSGLTSITVNNGNTKYDSRNNCNAIIEKASNTLIAGCKNTIIHNSVSSIGNYAFYGCSGLTSVTIPNSVTEIGGYAFQDCNELTEIYCKIVEPLTIESNVFSRYNANLYVDPASINKYKAKDPWCRFNVLSDETIFASDVTLNKSSLSLEVGDSETLVATITPSNATNKNVTWSSSNTSVATVDQNGKVTAKTVGTANITATTTDGTNLTATCQVTVISPPSIVENTITIGNGTVQDETVPIYNWQMGSYVGSECLYVKDQLADLKAGDKITSIAFYLMSGSAQGGNFNVRMKNTSISSLKNNADAHDTSCIEVNYNDQVNGNVTLEPYSGGQWINFPLSTPFVYNGENIIVDIRNTTPGTRSGWCYFATTTYNGVRRSLVWNIANSEDPHADGFNSGGIFGYNNTSNLPNIKITYTPSDVYATGISLNKTSTSLTVGATETLVATVTPSNATNKNVTWSSSNTSVATVDQNGKVTAKTVGTANITATTTDGTNLTATCQVTVTSPAQPEENTITIGNGTVANEGVPIVNWQMGSYIGSECLYLKDQLAGLKAGDKITSISFYLMSGSAKGGNFNVRMKNTSISSLKNNADAHDTSCIEVNYNDQVNGNVTLEPYSGGQWIYFPLSTPFVYNGGNIIIDIRNTTPGTRVGWCYFATTTYNGVRRSLAWHHANSENPHVDGFNDGGIYDYENRSDLPNIQITYLTTIYEILGDVNGDGHVSSVDVTALYNYLLNGDSSELVNGDVDGDGHISSVDVTAIYNLLLGE